MKANETGRDRNRTISGEVSTTLDYAPRRTDSFSQNKPRKISLKNKRLLDDYLFTSICFWEHWFPLENKLRFLNFPVGAGGVVVQKKPPNFSLLIFHREPGSWLY